MPLLRNLKFWLKNNEALALALIAGAFVTFFFAAAAWKYANFLYNGIDLAYFSQVFWNSLHGHFFSQTIHPHLSLGDHAEFAIPLLLPFFALWPDPRLLIGLQALTLAACVFPLHALCRQRGLSPLASLGIAAAFLFNPTVQHIALYEFHILPFALLPLFYALLAYDQGKFWRFLGFAALAMLVREDVALVVFVVGMLAWIERKAWHWRLAPAVVGITWFFAALRIIGHFSPDGRYKFLVYYSWLGDSPIAILTHTFTRLPQVLAHIMTIANLEMALGFLLPLAFLPLLAPRRLVLLLGPLAQILLGAAGGGSIVTDTHYATLFLPALFLAMIDGAKILPRIAPVLARIGIPDAKRMSVALVAVTVVYGSFALGPIIPASCAMTGATQCPGFFGADLANDRERAKNFREILTKIPATTSVASSYATLPQLATRERVYSLHYLFLDVTQFATRTYETPKNIDVAVFDTDDIATYRAQFRVTAWATPHYIGGFDRLDAALGKPVAHAGNVFLYQKNTRAESSAQPWDSIAQLPLDAEPWETLVLDALGTVRRINSSR